MNVKIKVISIIGKSRLTETEDAEKIVCAINEILDQGNCVHLSFQGIEEFLCAPIRLIGFQLYDGTEKYLYIHKDVEIVDLDDENKCLMHVIIKNVHRYMQRQSEYDEAWKMHEDGEES